MADHHATWAIIMEMSRVRFPDNEPAAQAFARFIYNVEDTCGDPIYNYML
jgi:hypothetical protein